jgi:hypothetical protein
VLGGTFWSTLQRVCIHALSSARAHGHAHPHPKPIPPPTTNRTHANGPSPLHLLLMRWCGHMLGPRTPCTRPFALVLADACPSTLLALAPLALVRADATRFAPPHSLHLLLWCWCWQMLAPLHSLHRLLWRCCGQMLAPPHSLHLFLWLWCGQMPPPPHSLHWLLWRVCGQTLRGFFCATPPTASASTSPRRCRLPPTLRARRSPHRRPLLLPLSRCYVPSHDMFMSFCIIWVRRPSPDSRLLDRRPPSLVSLLIFIFLCSLSLSVPVSQYLRLCLHRQRLEAVSETRPAIDLIKVISNHSRASSRWLRSRSRCSGPQQHTTCR